MAGTAKNFDTQTIIVDTIAQIWAGLAVPAAGARMTLATDPGDSANKTPDATENPSAIHLGHTKEGVKITITSSITKHYADEESAPVKATIEQTEFMFEGEFLQVFDEDVLKKLTPGFGTYATSSGYKEFSIGRKAISYDSIALIFPLPSDITKFGVAHIYNGINEAGLSFSISRKGMSSSPFKFVGYGLTSRAAADSLGKYWWQI